jgi:orotate phosphoribosyltransferase
MATTLPRAAHLIAQEIFELLKDTDIQAVGGVAIGADLMVAALVLLSDIEGNPMPGFVIRDHRKEHGTKKLIEGHFPKEKGAKVALIDDVITTGNSISKAIEIVEGEGCKVEKVVVLLDRQQGGSERLRKEGRDFVAILRSDASGEITIDESSAVAGHAVQGAIPR